MALIQERVNLARRGENDKVICRLRSGWVVIGDVQPLRGYCLLLADPVVPSINDLSASKRIEFLEEMTMVGDAIKSVTGAVRMNYEILGNSEPELHAHIFPRFDYEPDSLRKMPPFFYDWKSAPTYSESEFGDLKEKIADEIAKRTSQSTRSAPKIASIDHIQLAMPKNMEQQARAYFADTLGMVEEEKPYPLNERGGCWFRSGSAILHVGVDAVFAPQTKAHPAFLVADIQKLATHLADHGFTVEWDQAVPGRTRFYSADPFGNRIEFIQDGDGFSQRVE